MAALPGSNYLSESSGEAGFQSPTSSSFTTIDAEKGQAFGSSAADAVDSSAPRLRLKIWTVVGSIILRPFRWCKVKRQLIKDEKERLQVFYSDIGISRPAIEHYPEGWPQLAAFLHIADNFGMLRRFGLVRCRLLLQLQGEIQHLEGRLEDLDRSDAVPGSLHGWRLRKSDFETGTDPAQRELLKTLQEKVLIYDRLVLNEKELRQMGPVTEKDHRSVFNWMAWKRPLAFEEATWIHHQADCIPLSPNDAVEHSVLTAFLRKLFRSKGKASVTAFVKLFFVLRAVSILIVPVFILIWGPNTKAAVSATVLISVLLFSTLMTLFTQATVQGVLVGTAAYCAVLATFFGNIQD